MTARFFSMLNFDSVDAAVSRLQIFQLGAFSIFEVSLRDVSDLCKSSLHPHQDSLAVKECSAERAPYQRPPCTCIFAGYAPPDPPVGTIFRKHRRRQSRKVAINRYPNLR